jgi:hypothetical protein
MRIITTAVLLLAAVGVAATAEPPTQQKAAVAAAPSVTASDAQAQSAQSYDTSAATASTTASVLQADSERVAAEPERHPGWVFWTVLVVVAAAVVYIAWRFLTRGPPTATVVDSERETDRYRRGAGKGIRDD